MKSHHQIRPEQKLLTLCAGAPSPRSHERFQELLRAGGISWPLFLQLADRNEVVPLVYAHLSGFEHHIPATALSVLRKRCASIASWNLALASELLVLWRHFESNGIPAVAFKGPGLSFALYGNLGLRHCRDLDLLIETAQVWDAVRILEAEGYVADPQFPRQSEQEWLKAFKDVALRNPATGVHLELHWAVCEPAFDVKVHSSHLWQQTGKVAVLGTQIPFPSPDALLFLLAIHGARHYWNTLKWIGDIDRCLRTYPGLNWESILRVADTLGRRRTLLLPLKVSHDLLETPLPPRILSLLENEPGFSWLVNKTVSELFQPPERLCLSDESLLDSRHAAESDISKKLFRARTGDSLRNRLRYVFSLIRNFLEPDAADKQSIQAWRRQGRLFWLIQPVRLIRAHGLRFFLRTSKELFSAVVR